MRASNLAAEFGIDGVLAFADTAQGLVRADVTIGGAAATIYPYGAELTAWRPPGARPVLFTSSRSAFALGKAIRGGIPVIFPWFGPRSDGGTGPQHGFARTALWTLSRVERPAPDAVAVTFRLEPDAAMAALWAEQFRVSYTLTIGARLQLDLSVENRSDRPFRFEAALHTYFAVSDIGAVSLSGLQGCTYIDKVDGGTRKVQGPAPITWSGECDSVYLDTPKRCEIDDPGWQRRIVVCKQGAASTIAWNPGREKGEAMADLGDEWRGLVCVETGNVADNAITLDAGASQRMTTIVTLE